SSPPRREHRGSHDTWCTVARAIRPAHRLPRADAMPSAGPGWPVWAWPVAARSAPARTGPSPHPPGIRSEEHTSELQSRFDLVCRRLLEKKKNKTTKKQLSRVIHGERAFTSGHAVAER